MDATLLSIDCGTQSLRAMLFDASGHLLHKVKVEYEPYVSPRPGWAEQDANFWWKTLCSAVKELKNLAPGPFARIRGVGVATQRDTHILVDAEGNPVRPAILWLDTRKARTVYRPSLPKRVIFRAAGILEGVMKVQQDCRTNWVRQEQPDVWSRTHKALLLSGFINYSLTGVFRDTVAAQIGHVPFNYKAIRWAAPGELPALLVPIERERLPELVPAGSILGRVTAQASEATGIPEGLPVVACASDKGAETVGIGCVGEDRAAVSFGTTATVQTTSRRYFEPIAFMPPYPAALPGCYNPEMEIFRGYWMISWFKREFAAKEIQEAQAAGVAPEVILDRHLRAVPPGSMGLTTLPNWGPSLKAPGAKGAIIGFGDVHTRAHLYRSVIEGLAFALREGLERIERRGRLSIRNVGISGGATQSTEICQITADIFGRELFAGETYETAGLGTAVITAAGVGLYPSITEAVAGMVRAGRTYVPHPVNRALYEKIYRKVYGRMFGRLHPLHTDLRAIHNYPERAADEDPSLP